MKSLLTLLVFVTSVTLFAQKISYSFPEGYETVLSKKDYKYLVDESVKAISKYYKIVSVKEGVVQLEVNQDYSMINLHNLILRCADMEKEAWQPLISAHFEGMYESIENQKQIDPSNFESIEAYLSIRIYPENYTDQMGGSENLIVKTQLPGTISMLVLDLPSTFASIQKEMFLLWNKSIAEVFEIAQKNVNKQEFFKATKVLNLNGNDIEINFIENEDYGSSLALDLPTNAPEFIGEWGSVVAIPNKGLVNICMISEEKPLDFIGFIQQLKPVVEQFYNQHPQRVSKDFYWYYNNAFTKINIVESNGEFSVIAPYLLTELMTEK